MSRELVNIDRTGNDGGGGGDYTSKWVDCNAVKNAHSIISNAFLMANRSSFNEAGLTLEYICTLNCPLRAWNCFNAYHDKRYERIFLDVLSLSCLFIPHYGLAASIVIDLTSELVDICRKLN